ncbi:hypothetical protein F5Y05DRAFT_391255 [Hypoxylon sp. FL0543]|nr:hypothetical protein F5Y05DRAFT_391255 [Hypoxylon sp. FL0543]
MPPRTRNAASSRVSTRASAQTRSGESSRNNKAESSKPATRGRKRKSTELDLTHKREREKRARNQDAVELDTVPGDEGKPRLTTPDLEFDFDRSQLRDPRPTPGRVKRPRYDEFDMPKGFKERFYVPEPEKPKGRLNALQKDMLLREASILDPSKCFHDLHICHRKGREGSPTYDAAGFQLDWEKVDDWMRPTRPRKSTILNRMERALDRHAREQRTMYDIFFVDGKGPDVHETIVEQYLKDQVSKDLGVPWHQIGPAHLLEWEKKGFPKQKAEEWWREPNEVERARMLKMSTGSKLRKDL